MGELVVGRVAWLRRIHAPAPLVGGFLGALALLALRWSGRAVEVPSSGFEVDFLVGLLTANMGLHVTAKVLRQGLPVFLLFPAVAAVLFVAQLLVALPVAMLAGDMPLRAALLAGPVSYVGAPFNLNPPQQVPPIAGLLAPAVADPDRAAKGLMMLGVAAAVVLPGFVGTRLARGLEPPKEPLDAQDVAKPLGPTARDLAAATAAVLALVTAAFAAQALLQRAYPWLTQPMLPVIVLAYLFGVAARLAWSLAPRAPPFPKQALNLLLFGPTMGLVLAYAVLAAPLHLVAEPPPVLFVAGALAIAASVGASLVAFRLFARILEPYHAAAAATVLLGITTGWGPVAMAYLRQFAREEGPPAPIPAILPLNAFYLFPWLVIWMTRLVAWAFG